MSLLMDALRKAEAEKKAAAERYHDDSPTPLSISNGIEELQLEPLSESNSYSFDTDRSGELKLSSPADNTQRLGAGARRRSLADATVAEDGSLERTPGFLGIDNGTGDRADFVTSHTIFAANPRARATPTLAILGIVTALAIAGLLALGYQYFRNLQAPPALPSPRVAETLMPKISEHKVIAEPKKIEEVPAPTPEAVVTRSSTTTPMPSDDTPTKAAEALPTASQPTKVVSTPVTQRATGVEPQPEVADAEITSGQVHITRVSTISTLYAQLGRAYAAYVAGDLETAVVAYQNVLAKTPRQVDALLGLAAIELAGNHFADAHIHYQQVLLEQPEHPTATAALYLIEGVERPGVEAKLKLLLDRGIDAPYLHFALGNTYARKERWTDAQAAYFNALRGSPNNADYAYNLAVSLDHLQQSKSALTYYQQAKQAARAGHVAFNPAAVDARIAALTNALAPSTQ